jgi:hypothetical protein
MADIRPHANGNRQHIGQSALSSTSMPMAALSDTPTSPEQPPQYSEGRKEAVKSLSESGNENPK